MAPSPRTSTDHEEFEHIPSTSTPYSLSQAVHARRAEYTRPQNIRVKIGSWNVAACPGTERDLAGWFGQGKGVNRKLAGLQISERILNDGREESPIHKHDTGTLPGGDEIGIYVLGLQEVVDLMSAREYIGRVYTDPEPMLRWRKAVMDALPPGYVMISESQLSGLLLFIIAAPSIAPTISSVSSVTVGTGVMGYLGNKGAVTTRLVLGETTRLVFVNSHLASGTDPTHLERRCWDVAQILQRTHFDRINWSGVLDDAQEGIGEEDFAFWFGDLNFRLDGLPGDDIRRLLLLHTRGEYGIGERTKDKIDEEVGAQDGPIIIRSVESDSDSDEESDRQTNSTSNKGDDASSSSLPDPDDFIQDPTQDPASLQATLNSLLPHDQLRQVQKKRKAFHDGWREGPITFLPTYKYDVGSMGMFDSSEKKRAPSWCDRILFRTRREKLEYDEKLREENLARVKDEEMKARGIDQAGEDEDVLFDYNPEEDGVDSPINNEYDEYDDGGAELEPVLTKEGFIDRIHLDVYTSHQRVLSSDHKPLVAIFTLEYDAVVSELKSKIQQEVARELDRAENEGRPGVTIVVDHSMDDTTEQGPSIRRASSSAEGVEFGNVAYQQRKVRTLTIANTGQVPATFAFVNRPGASGEEDRIAPPWLSVCFVGSGTDEDEKMKKDLDREVTLEPGDAINATLELFVDDIALIRTLNGGTTQLDDVLVLRVTDGRDHFIPIRGSWLQTCFGCSVDELIRVPEGGVRALRPPRDGSSRKLVNTGQEVCWSAPRELFKLTEAVETLTERVIADSNMLDNAQLPQDAPSWPFDNNSWLLKDKRAREQRRRCVIEALDSDKNLNDSLAPEISAREKLEVMAEILIMFLGSLTDGIVTEALWMTLDQDIAARGAKQLTNSDEIRTWVLDVLSASPNHNISFVFLTSMLCRVAGELAPVPRSSWQGSIAGSARSSLDTMRRSLSWKGKAPPLPGDPAVIRRQSVERAYADVFKDVIFKGPSGILKDKEKKVIDERRREILEIFVQGGRES